jgi:hypothetical protein
MSNIDKGKNFKDENLFLFFELDLTDKTENKFFFQFFHSYLSYYILQKWGDKLTHRDFGLIVCPFNTKRPVNAYNFVILVSRKMLECKEIDFRICF